MTWSARLLCLAVTVVAAACATLTAKERESLDEVQMFADETAREYALRPIPITVGDRPVVWSDIPQVQVTHAILAAPLPVRDVLVARLLGYRVMQYPAPINVAHEAEINRVAWSESILAAVDILARVKGLPRRMAVEAVYASLRAQALVADEPRASLAPRPPHLCAQLAAFILAFSQYPLEPDSGCR